MKAELVEPVPVDKLVQLTMTKEQAIHLFEIVARTGGTTVYNHRKTTDELYYHLQKLLNAGDVSKERTHGLFIN